MPTVRFLREGLEVEVEKGANLRNLALEAGIELYQKPWNWLNCKGFGHCGTCRVEIRNDSMEGTSDLSFMESLQFKIGWPLSVIPFLNAFDYIGKEDELRLACQVTVEDDLDVYTRPSVNYYGDEEWQYKGSNPALSGETMTQQPEATPFERSEMEELGKEG